MKPEEAIIFGFLPLSKVFRSFIGETVSFILFGRKCSKRLLKSLKKNLLNGA